MVVEESMEQVTRKILTHLGYLGYYPVRGRNPLSLNVRGPKPCVASFIEMMKRKAIEIYCCMLLGTRAFPKISDVRPDM